MSLHLPTTGALSSGFVHILNVINSLNVRHKAPYKHASVYYLAIECRRFVSSAYPNHSSFVSITIIKVASITILVNFLSLPHFKAAD